MVILLLVGGAGYVLYGHFSPDAGKTGPAPAHSGAAAPEKPPGLTARLVHWLGTTRYLQDWTETLMNARGGAINRGFNDTGVKKQHLTTPLPNFGQADEFLFRGGQPSEEGFRHLRDRWHVTDILNLRLENDAERGVVKKLGLGYHYLPIPDTCAPTAEQVKEFRGLVRDTKGKDGRLFLHCAGGMGRTGTLAGVYRLAHGWSFDKVRTEMERFGWKENWFRQREQWQTIMTLARERERKGK